MPSVDLRLSVQRLVISLLGDPHLRDERFSGNAALDDPRWCRDLSRAPFLAVALVVKAVSRGHECIEQHEPGWWDG